MRALGILWRWQALVVLLGEVTLVLALIGDTSVLRRATVIALLALCPGLCFIRLAGLRFEFLADIAYSATASLVIVGIVAGSTLYAGVWSPEDVANAIAAALIVIASASAGRGFRGRREGTQP